MALYFSIHLCLDSRIRLPHLRNSNIVTPLPETIRDTVLPNSHSHSNIVTPLPETNRDTVLPNGHSHSNILCGRQR